ncbi:MAG: methyl-accepting chemotaxis protein [Moorellaceae bacterium]
MKGRRFWPGRRQEAEETPKKGGSNSGARRGVDFRFFQRLKLGTKLMGGFCLVIAIFVAVVIIVNMNLQSIHQLAQEVIKLQQENQLFSEMSVSIWEGYRRATDYIVNGSQANVASFDDALRRFHSAKAELDSQELDDKMRGFSFAMEQAAKNFESTFKNSIVNLSQEDRMLALPILSFQMGASIDNINNIGSTLKQEISRQREEAQQQLYAAVIYAKSTLLFGLVLAFLMGLLVALFFTRLIGRPVAQIVAYANRVAAGDLTGEPVKVRSRDELGQLSSVFNAMVEKLRQLIGQVRDLATEVARSSQELAQMSQEVGETARQVAVTAQEMARGAEHQAQQVGDTAQAIEAQAARVERVHRQAEEMAASSGLVLEKTAEGARTVEEANRQMEAISQRMSGLAKIVEELGQRSLQIGQIVGVISGIAEQTNLLALNAAIEAARAGEQGRGFAVVAEEVRKLAEQSARASEQIVSLINEIQQETGRVVNGMKEGVRDVEKGTEVMDRCGRSFAAIEEAINQLTAKIEDVTERAEEMAAEAGRIKQAAETLAAGTQEAAAGTEEVSAAAAEQTTAVAKIGEAAGKLARAARELETAVGQFKL